MIVGANVINCYCIVKNQTCRTNNYYDIDDKNSRRWHIHGISSNVSLRNSLPNIKNKFLAVSKKSHEILFKILHPHPFSKYKNCILPSFNSICWFRVSTVSCMGDLTVYECLYKKEQKKVEIRCKKGKLKYKFRLLSEEIKKTSKFPHNI